MYEHEVRGGFLTVRVGAGRRGIAARLRRLAIRWSSMEDPESADKMFRCSRMCWELSVGEELSDLDADDAEVLKRLPLDFETEELFDTLNHIPTLARVGMDPKTIHAASAGLAKSMLE